MMSSYCGLPPVDSVFFLAHQLDKSFGRNAQALGYQANDRTGAFNKTRRLQAGEARFKQRSVLAFETRQVDSFQLAQAEKKLLFECLLCGNALQIPDGNASRSDRLDVGSGIMSASFLPAIKRAATFASGTPVALLT